METIGLPFSRLGINSNKSRSAVNIYNATACLDEILPD
jgi:hypothetical protein